ncbi:MAG: hypothetical protein JW804_05565 [Sedimentisphaerales bacterium]|nr:hypothetical protein [Sedimentisphaerales bacterium]
MDNERIQKFGADKIFLFALFTLSLLLAWSIVKARSMVSVTEPIKLPFSGLSVQMPDKNGWVSDEKWEYLNNSFIISSTFAPNRVKQARVICNYQLASSRESAMSWLEQIAAETGSQITDSGTIHGFNAGIEWVYIERGQNYPSIIAATGELGYGRWLDINVVQTGTDKRYTQKVFEAVAASVSYEDNKLLKEGIEIVSRIKSAGLSRFMNFPDEPATYLIQNVAQGDVGFAIESIISSEDEEETEVQMQSFVYLKKSLISPGKIFIGGNSYLEEGNFFQSDNNLQEYVFNSQSNLPSENVVTVHDGNLADIQILEPKPQQYQQQLGLAVMPGAVVETVFKPMMTSDKNRILVDVLTSTGEVQPALISIKENVKDEDGNLFNLAEITYTGQDNFEKVYLDQNMQTVKKEIKQNNIQLLLIRSDIESLIHRFPERADFIVERIKTIKTVSGNRI